MGIFIALVMLNSGGGGGVDGFGILAIPYLTIYSAPRSVFRTLLSSSLSDAPNKGLYSVLESRFLLNVFPLHVVSVRSLLNINLMV